MTNPAPRVSLLAVVVVAVALTAVAGLLRGLDQSWPAQVLALLLVLSCWIVWVRRAQPRAG